VKLEKQEVTPFTLLVGAILGGLVSFAMVAGAAGLALLALKFLMTQIRGM